MQWSKSVNNRDLEFDNASKSFFSHGTGELERASDACDGRLAPHVLISP